MKPKFIYTVIILIINFQNSIAQTKAMYVDFFFSSILGVDVNGDFVKEREVALLEFARDNNYNYLLLYDAQLVFDKTQLVTSLPPSTQDVEANLASFIALAKSSYGILEIGVTLSLRLDEQTGVYSGHNFISDNLDAYNGRYPSSLVDVMHMEFEFWNLPTLFIHFGYTKFIEELTQMNTLKSNSSNPFSIETYIASVRPLVNLPNPTISAQQQADEIDNLSDRVALTLYFNGNWIHRDLGPNHVDASYFFQKDAFWGKRYELFANNTKQTHFLILFSAEESDEPDNNWKYFGDYLNLVNNSYTFNQGASRYDDTYFGNMAPEDKVYAEFLSTLTIPDPYNHDLDPQGTAGYGPHHYPCPSGGFPCGSSGSNQTTLQQVASFDAISRPKGNVEDGVLWFKYGLLPNSKFYSWGQDVVAATSTFLITTDERLTNSGIEGPTFSINTRTMDALSLNHVAITNHQWYSFNNGMFEPITGAISSSYSGLTLPAPNQIEEYLHEITTSRVSPIFFAHQVREKLKVDNSAWVPSGGATEAIAYDRTPTNCPNYNDGSFTVNLTCINCIPPSGVTVQWNDGTNFYQSPGLVNLPYTITGLTHGTYDFSITAGAIYSRTGVQIEQSALLPMPEIFSTTHEVFCDPNLNTYSIPNNSYQWNLNGQQIVGANSSSFLALSNGSYTVTVVNAEGCQGTSSPFILFSTPTVNISGYTYTCQNSVYTVDDGGDRAGYVWAVPVGATFTKFKNTITVDWGTATLNGGTITCTVTNSCGSSSSGSLDVIPFISSAVSTLSCNNMNIGSVSVSIINGGLTPYSYLWNGSGNPTTQLVSNLAAGTYTVTVTDANNCTATSSATVSNFPAGLAAPLINGTQSASPGTHIYSLSNYNASYDNYYTWLAIANSGNATISYPNSNKQSASIQWPASGGRVEVKFGVVGCQETVVYYVQPYCTNTFTYPDGSNQSNISSANTITRTNMSINGLFSVTDDFTFKDCGHVALAAGAKIVVASGKTLTIDNCTFGPGTCCKMWKGIKLESGAKIIIKNGSTITQAEYGIVVNNGSIYEITDSHFRNNYVSLQVGTGVTTTTTGSKIFNTDFYSDPYTCGGSTYYNFVPKYEGQITNPGSVPLAGIKADNVTYMKFGSSTPVNGGDVRFFNLNNGVISNNSNLYVQNSRFTNMLPGCGILAQEGIVNLIGLGGDYANSTNTFENCQWGVNASKCDLTVNSVRSNTDVNTAIYFSDCGEVYINNNALGAKYYGIRGYNNPNSNIVIEKNSIHMSSNPVTSACIRIDEFGLDNPVTIDHNDLYLNHGRYGILTYGMNNALVKENYIQMNNVSNVAGIRSYFSQKNTFQCNTIYALNRYNSYQSGISLSLSPENTISCNWMSNQFEGLGIHGACSPLEIKGNVFNDHAFGLNLTFNGLMGVQTNNGNQWNGNYTQYGAYLSGINSASALANQVQFYDPNGNGTMPTTTNDIMNLDWFLDNGNPDEFSCYAYDCQPFIPIEENDRIEDEIIADNDDIGTEFVDPSNYFADRFLFDRLTEDPTLMTNNNILLAFYNQKLYGSIGQFNEMNQEIEEAVKWETVYHMVYVTNESMIRNAVDSLDILDSLYENGYNGPSNYDDLNQTIATLKESNALLRETIESIQNYRIENAIDNNELIQVSDQFEENEAIVNNIYLETVAAGKYELATEQITSLLQVAIQCPFTGGPSVYKARSLYFLADAEADWDDDAICISNGIQPRMSRAEAQYSLFPNPTTGIITLKYHIESEDRAMLNVYTTLGVLISSTALDADNPQIEVDLSSFKPALYHYKIIVNDQQKRQGMISIIR